MTFERQLAVKNASLVMMIKLDLDGMPGQGKFAAVPKHVLTAGWVSNDV